MRLDLFEERKEVLQEWTDLLDQMERGGVEVVKMRTACDEISR